MHRGKEGGRGRGEEGEREREGEGRKGGEGGREGGWGHLGNGDVEVEFEGEDCSCQEHYEHYKGRILKVSQLQLQWPKLHPPPDIRVRGRRLESHALPISRLNVL